MKRIVFGVLHALAGLLIAALTLEALTRFVADDGMQYDLEMWKYARDVKQIAADPLLGHEHAPNRQARLMGVDFRTNSHGLRDREFSYQRPDGKLRILMLGDSVTVGWGVALDDTFSKVVERLFAASGVDAEVINTGVGNYNTGQEVQYFLTKGHRYRPDVVVLNFFVNDAEPLVTVGAPSSLMRACYACAFVPGRADTVMRSFFGRMNWFEYYVALYDGGRSKGWLDAKASIARLADFSRKNGFELIVASLPELHEVENYRLQRITDLVRQAADQHGAGFVDLLPHLQTQPSSKLWVTPPDPHPNALAHRLIAQGLFEALQGRGAKR